MPTNAHDAQRQAIIEAAEAAGLRVLQIIHEPVAALLAYSADESSRGNEGNADRNVLVVDIGGVRSDAAVVAVHGGMYTILSTAHDEALGGDNIDEALFKYMASEFMKKTKASNPGDNARSKAKLMLEVEAAKKVLSASSSASISIESLSDGQDMHASVNRSRLGMLMRDIATRCVSLAQEAVHKADLHELDIAEVVMCGGSSNLHNLQMSISDAFSHSRIRNSINPSETCALGAAIQAHLISTIDPSTMSDSEHAVVTSALHLERPIGVQITEGGGSRDDFITILHSETSLPAKASKLFVASAESVKIGVYEGKRTIRTETVAPQANGVAENDDEDEEDEEPTQTTIREMRADKALGELVLGGLKPGSKVEVILQADKDGVLSIVARDTSPSGSVVRGQI